NERVRKGICMVGSMTQLKVWEELRKAAKYNAGELAKLSNVSLRTLQRQFQNTLGRSPQHWLTEYRIHDAKALLLRGLSIKEAACDLEYKHLSHFCRQFKAHVGITPSQFVATSGATSETPASFSLTYAI